MLFVKEAPSARPNKNIDDMRSARTTTCYLLPYFQHFSKLLKSLLLLPSGRQKEFFVMDCCRQLSARARPPLLEGSHNAQAHFLKIDRGRTFFMTKDSGWGEVFLVFWGHLPDKSPIFV
jgi:hypothetical protein